MTPAEFAKEIGPACRAADIGACEHGRSLRMWLILAGLIRRFGLSAGLFVLFGDREAKKLLRSAFREMITYGRGAPGKAGLHRAQDFPVDIGRRLQVIRASHDQQTFAESVGCTKDQWSALEQGRGRLDVHVLARIAERESVDLSTLILGEAFTGRPLFLGGPRSGAEFRYPDVQQRRNEMDKQDRLAMGARITEVRHGPQSAFARSTGVPQQSLSRYEQGEIPRAWHFLIGLAEQSPEDAIYVLTVRRVRMLDATQGSNLIDELVEEEGSGTVPR
jgi:transcriptional regulator with XRE-family HTH domain